MSSSINWGSEPTARSRARSRARVGTRSARNTSARSTRSTDSTRSTATSRQTHITEITNSDLNLNTRRMLFLMMMRQRRQRRENRYSSLLSFLRAVESGSLTSYPMYTRQMLIAKMPGSWYSLATPGRGPLRNERANIVTIEVINVLDMAPNRFFLRFLKRWNDNNRTRVELHPSGPRTFLDVILQALARYFLRPEPTKVQLVFARYARHPADDTGTYKLYEGEYWASAHQDFARTVRHLTGW